MNGRHVRTTIAMLAAAAAALLAPAAALASHTQRSIFEDDSRLLYSGPGVRESTLDELKGLGVDVIHVQLRWDHVAPSPGSRKKPSFNAADPAAYPAGAWSEADSLVRDASARGMGVLLTLTGPGPQWAEGCHVKGRPGICKPSAKAFASFARAAGTRYSGSYQGLPRVSRWSIWNEPNLYKWLYPQQEKRKGRVVDTSAATYRSLFRAAASSLRATGHRRDSILVGETAPVGTSGGTLARHTTAPATFLRQVFCIDGKGHRLKGRASRAASCGKRYAKLAATGVAHHPYTPAAACNPRCKGGRNDITIASLGRLVTLVNQAGRAGRLRRHAPIELTEFGFESDPPDRFSGISLTRQALYINWADALAYRIGQVASVAQYTLWDDSREGTFVTGLRRSNGKAKPSLGAYRMPIFVTAAGRSHVQVFGQARPARGKVRVAVQRKTKGKWRTVATVTTNGAGYLNRRLKGHGGQWRLSWTPAGGAALHSRTAGVN